MAEPQLFVVQPHHLSGLESHRRACGTEYVVDACMDIATVPASVNHSSACDARVAVEAFGAK
jgi:hypothetical protein